MTSLFLPFAPLPLCIQQEHRGTFAAAAKHQNVKSRQKTIHTSLSWGIWWEPWLWGSPGLSRFCFGVDRMIVFRQNPGRALLCKHAGSSLDCFFLCLSTKTLPANVRTASKVSSMSWLQTGCTYVDKRISRGQPLRGPSM